MTGNLRVALALISVLLAFAAVTWWISGHGPRYRLLSIARQSFVLEIGSPADPLRGLRGRGGLDAGRGWLVRLDQPRLLAYSSKGMPFGFDVLFIDARGSIRSIVSLPADDQRLGGASSGDPVHGAVLLPEGTARQLRLQLGEMIRFPEDEARAKAEERRRLDG